MLSLQACFLIFLVASLLAAWVAWKQTGARSSLGAGMAVSLLTPTWVVFDVFGLPFEVRSSLAAILLIAYCLHSSRQVFSRFVFLDYLIGGIAIWQVVVNSYHEAFGIDLVAFTYGEWILPFAAGRIAVMHRRAIANLSPWFACVGIAIASLAILESLTKINLWESLFHEVDDVIPRTVGTRYGFLHRAIGPTRHGILLAIVIMTLMPWAVQLISGSGRRRILGWVGMILMILAVIATGSRGPVLALAIAGVAVAALRNRISGAIFVVLFIGTLIFVSFNAKKTADWFDSFLGRKTHNTVVVVDGEAEVYTGTTNRIFALRVYGPLILKGGPLGYGTTATSTFPPNIPGLPTDASSRQRLGIVDNSYLFVGLRLGWVGMALYIALLISGIGFAISLRHAIPTYYEDTSYGFSIGVAAIIFAICIEITTVFSQYDFVFWVLFLLGMVAGLRAYTARALRGLEIDEG